MIILINNEFNLVYFTIQDSSALPWRSRYTLPLTQIKLVLLLLLASLPQYSMLKAGTKKTTQCLS